MEISMIAKYVAFEEIFSKYSLPTVVKNDNSFKSVDEWFDEIDLDDIDWRYKKDNFNVFKDNSLSDILKYFKDPLINYYFKEIRFHEEKKAKEEVKEETKEEVKEDTTPSEEDFTLERVFIPEQETLVKKLNTQESDTDPEN